MGLMDRKKKGSEEKGKDEIGGLVSENENSYAPTSAPTIGAPAIPEPETKQPEAAAEGGKDSSLDIFTEEVSETEENTLAGRLPEVDVFELLRECQEVAAELFGDDYGADDGYGSGDGYVDDVDLNFI